MRWLANSENLIQNSNRSREEVEEIRRKGGKASGEARRRKADFRKTLNLLLTTEIDSPEWTPILNAMGLDSTLESAINMAIIKEALAGDIKAYTAIRDTIGQTTKSDADLEEQKAKVDAVKSKSQSFSEEDAQDDGFIDALNSAAGEDWDSENKETNI